MATCPNCNAILDGVAYIAGNAIPERHTYTDKGAPCPAGFGTLAKTLTAAEQKAVLAQRVEELQQQLAVAMAAEGAL